MITRQLYIDNILMDIAEVSIPLNFQCSEVADLTGIISNFSYSIKLPKTANNLQAIEQAQEFSNETDYALVKHTGRYYINGIPIFENAEVRVFRVIDQIEIAILFGNYGLFSEIEKVKLTELTTITDVLMWNYALAATTNAGWAIADYGDTVINGLIHAERMRPYVKVKSLFDAIIPSYVMPTPISDKIAILNLPLLSENSNADNLDDILVAASGGADVVVLDTSTPVGTTKSTTATWLWFYSSSDVYNLYHKINGLGQSIGWVIIPKDGWYSVELIINIYGLMPTGGYGNYRFDCVLLNNEGEQYLGDTDISYDGFSYANLNLSTSAVYLKKNNYHLLINAVFNRTVNWGGYPDDFVAAKIASTSHFEFSYLQDDPRNKDTKTAYKLKYPVLPNLPNVSQKDFIKSIMQLFGMMVYINDGVPNFFTFKEVYENFDNAYDWSDNLILTDKFQTNIDFSSDVAEINYLKYKKDDKLSNVDYGNSSIPAINQFLKEKDIVVNQVFSATENSEDLIDLSNNHFSQCKLPVWERQTNGYKLATVTPRICQDSIESINLGMATAYGEPTGIAPGITSRHVHRFENDGNGLIYDDLIQNYWQEYSGVINKFKQCKLKFILPPKEIINFKFDIPIYLQQYSRYFFVKKINNWQPNTIIEVDLILL
ncbi:MAG: hypothetical protein ACOYO1_18275 [Bacteroidales bacterium]